MRLRRISTPAIDIILLKDILLAEARLEHLQRETSSCVHQKRSYTKRNTSYWETEIYEQRKRPAVSDDD